MVDDIEKFKELTDQIDNMITIMIDPFSEEFISWKTKATRILERIYGDNSKEYKDFSNRLFFSFASAKSSGYKNANAQACREALIRTKAKFKVYIEELGETSIKKNNETNSYYTNSKIFIVHGHDGELKEKVKSLVEQQGIGAIVLNEQPNQGKTIIEKLEFYSNDADAAICLFTADDEMKDGNKRARENVVLETGYFYGKKGRERTIIIAEDNVIGLSDLKGIVYVNRANWEIDVLKELKAIGFSIDLNKLI